MTLGNTWRQYENTSVLQYQLVAVSASGATTVSLRGFTGTIVTLQCLLISLPSPPLPSPPLPSLPVPVSLRSPPVLLPFYPSYISVAPSPLPFSPSPPSLPCACVPFSLPLSFPHSLPHSLPPPSLSLRIVNRELRIVNSEP